MTGIVVIAHAPLASALGRCAQHIYSCEPDVARREVRLLDVEPGAELAAVVAQARELVREVDSGHGVLVLTDAFGATPGNVASQLATPGKINVVAGVNLPMLLRAVCYRGGALAELTEKALAGGQRGMLQIGAVPPQVESSRPQGDDQQRLHDPQ